MFHSVLSPEAVLATVARTTDKQSMTLFSLSGFKGEQPFLSEVCENRFRLRKRIFYRNSFARILAAKISADLDGTTIEARFAMSILVRAFMMVWFGFLALAEVTIAITVVRVLLTPGTQLGANEYMLVLVPSAMLIFGWLLVAFGLRISRRGEREMVEFVEQTLAARRLPNKP